MTTAKRPYLLDVTTVHGGGRGYRCATFEQAIEKAKTVKAPHPIASKVIRLAGRVIWTA